ncbi:MAG TPA: sigma-54 dependent transcriptional regulator [Oligoflexia bacterium]|nr:sigma-54 dependent transcriptional regulator [Oligoflexia bacterium]HMP47575.1 sigma-54 dependent transcriptional regulator [Oligoflexia bacterium]
MFDEVVQSERFESRHVFDQTPAAFSEIITSDPGMNKIFNVIERVAETNSTVLILGESGTGKELIARAIHTLSRLKGHFVPVNCGAIPDNLLESELFGYEKGAFTGAVSSKPGRFSLADGGTIFLDEIGDMSPHLQVKLLRVLQDRMVESVGGLKPRSVNVRVIAATNVDLRTKVREGKFREDLFYRLQVVPVELPSLKSRSSDIELLLGHFASKYAEIIGRRPIIFTDDVLTFLNKYSWPGNVRELENLVQRLTLLVDGDYVELSDLPESYLSGEDSKICGVTVVHHKLPPNGLDFNVIVEQFENQLILQALERTNGNKKAAAELLNLNRTTLVEKIKKKGLAGSSDCDRIDDLVGRD